jgi:hypothetical protein
MSRRLLFESHAADAALRPPQLGGRAGAARRPEARLGRKERLRDYPMPAADVPLIPILQDWL